MWHDFSPQCHLCPPNFPFAISPYFIYLPVTLLLRNHQWLTAPCTHRIKSELFPASFTTTLFHRIMFQLDKTCVILFDYPASNPLFMSGNSLTPSVEVKMQIDPSRPLLQLTTGTWPTPCHLEAPSPGCELGGEHTELSLVAGTPAGRSECLGRTQSAGPEVSHSTRAISYPLGAAALSLWLLTGVTNTVPGCRASMPGCSAIIAILWVTQHSSKKFLFGLNQAFWLFPSQHPAGNSLKVHPSLISEHALSFPASHSLAHCLFQPEFSSTFYKSKFFPSFKAQHKCYFTHKYNSQDLTGIFLRARSFLHLIFTRIVHSRY